MDLKKILVTFTIHCHQVGIVALNLYLRADLGDGFLVIMNHRQILQK